MNSFFMNICVRGPALCTPWQQDFYIELSRVFSLSRQSLASVDRSHWGGSKDPLCLEWLLRGQLLVIPIVLIDYNGGKVNFLPKGMLPSEKARNSFRVISSEEIYFQIVSLPELPYLVLSWHLFFLLSLIVW